MRAFAPGILMVLAASAAIDVESATPGAAAMNWYQSSFFLLHLDHHTGPNDAVGRGADPAETARLLGLSHPDVIQIHAKGRPGWTTYPSQIGHTPPKLARDVLEVWRDIARRDGYHFSIYYNIGRDGVIMKQKPEWNRVKANGEQWDTALCYNSGVAEAYLWPMIQEIQQRYQPDGFWFDGSCFTVWVCFCDKCRERFQRETGLDAPKKPTDPGWDQYKEMQRRIYREFVHETAARVKQADPRCLVAFNWAFSTIMPEKPDPLVDYLTGDRACEPDILSVDAHWYDAQDKPFDLMTTIHLRYPDGTMKPKPDRQLEQEMAIIVANGGRYFAWDNPTKESGLVAERQEHLAKVVAPFLRARQERCLNSKRAPDVSVLNDTADHYAALGPSTVCFRRTDARLVPITEALCRAHLNYEMVSDWRLADLDVRSPALIVENPKALSPGAAESLRRWVERGGTLLATGQGFADVGLKELVGLEVEAKAQAPEDWTLAVGGKPVSLRQQAARVRLAGAEAILTGQDAQGRQSALFTKHRVGKGQALCVPFALFSNIAGCDVPPNLLAAVLREARPEKDRLLRTNAPETVETVLRQKDGDWVLHLVNRAPGDRKELPTDKSNPPMEITNIPPVAPCHVSLRLDAKPAVVRLEPGATELKSWKYEADRLEADLPEFPIHQMMVVERQ
ncbi:MAG: hypothetical protein NTW86_11815 [Candidatus Sumerlaeota bacterium]|nr:hypothetical protein [Candidatus Sumerlaeota bacterium]